MCVRCVGKGERVCDVFTDRKERGFVKSVRIADRVCEMCTDNRETL